MMVLMFMVMKYLLDLNDVAQILEGLGRIPAGANALVPDR